MSFNRSLLSFGILLACWLTASGQEAQRWIFEGLITESAPVLAPSLQSGWVLSGSFSCDSLQMEQESYQPELRSGRMTGGVDAAELTVDLYYQVRFHAIQTDGVAGFDFQQDNPEADGRDLLGWFFPMNGALGESGWSIQWLQIWLADPSGDMITHLPVQISPIGINWRSGWFRLTFVNPQGDSVHADGRIEIFSPEGELDENSAESSWYGVAADLSNRLLERDGTIATLRSELQEVRSRLDGLRRMVDVLVEERADLQEENELLNQRAAAADPTVLTRLSELRAERSLLEIEMQELSEETTSLKLRLAASEQQRETLSTKLGQMEEQAALEAAAPQFESPPVTEVPVVADTVPDQEVPVEEIILETADQTDETVPEITQPENQQDLKRIYPLRRKGPRKFR